MRTLTALLPFWLSLLATAPASSSPAAIGIPTLGYAYDSSLRAVRSIRGIPGAAFLGDPVGLDFALAEAAVSPQQDSALAVSAGDGQLYLVLLSGQMPHAVPLAGAISAPDRMVFSPSGSAAVLYQNSSNRLQIVTGLPDAPLVQDLNATAFGGPPVVLAPSDDGHLVLLSPAGQDADPVWLLATDGTALQLTLPGSTLAAAFRKNSHDAVAVTRTGDIYVVRNAGADASYRQAYAGDAQTSAPVAARFSADGSLAHIATSQGILSVVDLASSSANATPCHCTPSGLEPLNSTATFRLNGISDLPLLLFDGSPSGPQVWFVPPDHAPVDSTGSAQ